MPKRKTAIERCLEAYEELDHDEKWALLKVLNAISKKDQAPKTNRKTLAPVKVKEASNA